MLLDSRLAPGHRGSGPVPTGPLNTMPLARPPAPGLETPEARKAKFIWDRKANAGFNQCEAVGS